jgi:hypothetical protein
MGPEITALEFRPDLKHEHLHRFLDRIRPGMPDELWQIVEPYTLIPRSWDSQTYGLAEPMDQTTGPWVCELNAPILWHELLGHLKSVELTNTRPTLDELGAAWRMLKNAGLRPSIAVNLGPVAEGKWLLEVVAVVASGKIERTTAIEVASILGGQLGGMITWPESVWWRTSV